MANRTIKIHHDHEYVEERNQNVANIRSSGLVIAPPNNTFLFIDRLFLPVIRLFDNAGELISGSTRVYLSKKRPGDLVPTPVPGVFRLNSFNDLTSSEQRNRDNRATLVQDLGVSISLREQETLLIEFEGPDVIDWTQAGTTFEFTAAWGSI